MTNAHHVAETDETEVYKAVERLPAESQQLYKAAATFYILKCMQLCTIVGGACVSEPVGRCGPRHDPTTHPLTLSTHRPRHLNHSQRGGPAGAVHD